jgi:LacI family transcriptional regulator
MTTIKDVARIAGVSVASVSRVINNGPKVSQQTRDKVSKIMRDLGYTPNANARALVKRKSMTIGVVIPELTDPFFANLAHSVDVIARQNSMQLLLSTALQSPESEQEAINLLVEQRCQIIVLHSKQLSDDALISLCNKMPQLVLIDRFVERIKHKCIWLDNREGGKIAARHLMSLNHRAMACVSSKYTIEDPLLRLTGFKDELNKSGIILNDELIQYAEPNQQGGEKATQYLLASGKPFTAIFAYNDAMAIGVITALEDNGFRVPHDVSVLGFDDGLIARYAKPRLTTLHYPIDEMAQKAALLAFNSANEPQNSGAETFKYLPYLVKRESTSYVIENNATQSNHVNKNISISLQDAEE